MSQDVVSIAVLFHVSVQVKGTEVRVKTAPIERMLNRLVVDPDDCWVWPGAVSGGYGQVRDTERRTTLQVHRVSYKHFIGPIAAGEQVDHNCHGATCQQDAECKHRRCWNPRHLSLVESKAGH